MRGGFMLVFAQHAKNDRTNPGSVHLCEISGAAHALRPVVLELRGPRRHPSSRLELAPPAMRLRRPPLLERRRGYGLV